MSNFKHVVNTNEFLVELFKLGLEYEQQIHQWIGLHDYARAADYQAKLECITTILESYHIFHQGMGLNGKGRGIQHRFHTFDKLYLKTSKEKSPTLDRS